MSLINDLDKAILNRIQSNFPITPRPYLSIADDLQLSENDIIKRINHLKKNGIIRRIGGILSPGKLEFVSTLCAAKVPENQIDSFAQTVNQFTGVTHNYLRDNSYNIWFTFIAPSTEEIKENLKQISEQTGITDILNLPATKVFKIKAHFDLL